MDGRRQVLLLPTRGAVYSMARQRTFHVQVQVGRSQFDRMARDDAKIKAIEPARMPVLPGTFRDDGMLVNAKSTGFCEGTVGHLIHPNRTRRRPIHFERLDSPRPAPVRARDRVAGALRLRKRCEELGRDRRGGVLVKDRRVAAPCLGGGLEQRPADWKKQLRGLTDDLVYPVDGERQRQQCDGDDGNLDGARRAAEYPTPAAAVLRFRQ